MGFNLSQIVNKFLPTKRVDDDLRENPFNTAEGQEIASISESFWARSLRLGRIRGNMWSKQAFSATSSWNYPCAHNAEPGYRLYVAKIVLSADVDCEVDYKVWNGVQGVTNTYEQMSAFVKAGTPLVLNFNGEIVIESETPSGQTAAGIYLGVNNASTAGNLWASVIGIEVSSNA